MSFGQKYTVLKQNSLNRKYEIAQTETDSEIIIPIGSMDIINPLVMACDPRFRLETDTNSLKKGIVAHWKDTPIKLKENLAKHNPAVKRVNLG